MKVKDQHGFTLVEVLVALAVLVSAVVVLAQSIGGAASAYTWMEERTDAWLIASDKLVELQVFHEWPSTGTHDETVERDDKRWEIRTHVSDGPWPGTRRVDIEVGPEDSGHTSHTLSSLLARPGGGMEMVDGENGE